MEDVNVLLANVSAKRNVVDVVSGVVVMKKEGEIQSCVMRKKKHLLKRDLVVVVVAVQTRRVKILDSYHLSCLDHIVNTEMGISHHLRHSVNLHQLPFRQLILRIIDHHTYPLKTLHLYLNMLPRLFFRPIKLSHPRLYPYQRDPTQHSVDLPQRVRSIMRRMVRTVEGPLLQMVR